MKRFYALMILIVFFMEYCIADHQSTIGILGILADGVCLTKDRFLIAAKQSSTLEVNPIYILFTTTEKEYDFSVLLMGFNLGRCLDRLYPLSRGECRDITLSTK